MIDPSKEDIWREKSIKGELTIADIKEIVAYKREGRISASYAASTAKKTRKPSAKAVKESEDLLAELDLFSPLPPKEEPIP